MVHKKGEKPVELRKSTVNYNTANFLTPSGRVVVNDENELKRLYDEDGTTRTAIKKKVRDLVYGTVGAKIREGKDSEVISSAYIDEINDFLERLDFKEPFVIAMIEAMVYGNGFCEVVYAGDKKRPEEPANGSNTTIYEIVNIDSTQTMIVIDDRDVINGRRNPNYGKIAGYYVVSEPHKPYDKSVSLSSFDYSSMPGVFLHPSRVLHFGFDFSFDYNVSSSIVAPALHIIQSKIEADKHLGTILVRYAKPIIKAVIENGTQDQIRNLQKTISKVNSNPSDVASLVTDDAISELDYLGGSNAAIPNPKEFYSVLIDNIAMNFGIPKTLLIGTEQGSISGSDLNLTSYFQSIQVEQEQIVGKALYHILKEYWRLKYGAPLPEEIQLEFESVYADEIAYFKSTLMNTQAVTQLYKEGLITRNEAREQVGLKKSDKEGSDTFREPKDDKNRDKNITPEGTTRGSSSNLPR